MPTPGEPITTATRAAEPSTARLSVLRSAASSRLRPTSVASWRCANAGAIGLRSTRRYACTGSRFPLISIAPSGSSVAAWSIRRPASSPTTIASESAAPLEPRGDADRLSGDEALSRIGRRRDDLSGLDPDPDLEPDPVLLDELLVERGDADADVERGASRAQRVVLVRHRDAERGHDRVARVLLDRAAVTRDRRRDGLEVAPQHRAERLGVERLGERHRLDDVDEEDRDEPPELHRRPGERRLLEQQRLVLAEDRGLELAELGAGSMPSSSTRVSRAAR